MSSGGKGGKSAKAPDYTALANQQAQLNMEAAKYQTAANRPNQYDAFGNSVTWSQQPSDAQRQYDEEYARIYAIHDAAKKSGNYSEEKSTFDKLRAMEAKGKPEGTWTQQQTLSPEIKAIWDKYIGDSGQAMSRYGDILNSYLGSYSQGSPYGDFSSGAQNLKAYNDPEFDGKAVADALYGSVMDRGRVEQERETDRMNTQLRQQGLVPGSEAYNRAMQNLMTSQNDANLLAGQNATLAGANESRAKYAAYLQGQGQQYGQDLSTYGTNRDTYLGNRNQPLQELAGLAGIAGGQPYTPTYPGFSGATGYQPADLVGAAQAQYSAKQNSANASNSKKGGVLGAGASLGGSFLGSK